MKLEELDYPFDSSLIAHAPLKERDHSKLMVVNREKGDMLHHTFYELAAMLGENDVLVFNDSKVIPARLFGTKEGGSAHIEVLLLREQTKKTWKVLIKNSKRLKPGDHINFIAHKAADSTLSATLLDKHVDGTATIRFQVEMGELLEVLQSFGHSPIPPYIKEQHVGITSRYQNVYAEHPGSAAAPTAGFHFTPRLLEQLKARGVQIEYVTMHVGLGTFQPIKEALIEEHKMHEEWYSINSQTAERLNQAKAQGKRIIAVGTTSVRTLESAVNNNGILTSHSANTGLFIRPGFTFKFVDSVITNFHLPKSTLLLLIMAFSSKELINEAYQLAQKEQYRFYSYGDSMWIK